MHGGGACGHAAAATVSGHRKRGGRQHKGGDASGGSSDNGAVLKLGQRVLFAAEAGRQHAEAERAEADVRAWVREQEVGGQLWCSVPTSTSMAIPTTTCWALIGTGGVE